MTPSEHQQELGGNPAQLNRGKAPASQQLRSGGGRPPAPAAPPPAPSTDSRAAPAGFPARFAAGTFIQIRSTGAAAGAPCVVSSSVAAAAASQAPGAFAPAADGGQRAGSSLYCTPHGPAGRTALLQPALGGGGGRPPVIFVFPRPRGRVKGTLGGQRQAGPLPAAVRARGGGRGVGGG
uniref:Uncharacterized protein n=1 Tax=Strigops habroptila TaxID=2489341 RepID=A0A672UV94_STRHB